MAEPMVRPMRLVVLSAITLTLLVGTSTPAMAQHASRSPSSPSAAASAPIRGHDERPKPRAAHPRRRAAEPRVAKSSRAPQSPVLSVLKHMDHVVKTTRYVHATQIDEAAGRFDFDCSAMAAWVLSRATPVAHQTVMEKNGVGRPVAANYHDVIARAPTDHAAGGWQRIPRIEDVRPGDVLAWRRPPSVLSTNTGHVAFVVGKPRRIAPGRNYFEVRVADSTSVLHLDDSREKPRHSGFGYGTMSFGVDPKTHQGLSYGWMGGATPWYPKTEIEFGRPVR